MDKIFEKYLSKHQIWQPTKSNAKKADIRVIVPVFLEEECLFVMLDSIKNAALKTTQSVEVVLVFNYADSAQEDIKQRQLQLLKATQEELIKYVDYFPLTTIEAFDLPHKHAGAGYARKIGMDYAVSCFVSEQNRRGLLISLDADCIVEDDYFEVIYSTIEKTQANGGTIRFEHQIKEIEDEQKHAIEQYELHLRYYMQVARWAGHPYAYHTVGSAFAVTAEAYVRAGGMPRRQAGEDFYFLQKAIALGNFIEINDTCVYPSSRISDRVPFGTGPTVAKLVNDDEEYLTYNLQAFIELKEFFDIKEKLFKVTYEAYVELLDSLSGRMRSFLMNSGFFDELENIIHNCSTEKAFNKRFFEVFDMFKLVKYLNYVHEHFLEKVAIYDASLDFLDLIEEDTSELMEVCDILSFYREWEKYKDKG